MGSEESTEYPTLQQNPSLTAVSHHDTAMNPGLYCHEHHSLRLSVMKRLAFGLDLPNYIQHTSVEVSLHH